MKKIFSSMLNLGVKHKKNIKISIKCKDVITELECTEGQNLMDATNRVVNDDVNVYGLCDKQLACTTCSVQVLKHYERLPEPSEQQLDILYSLNDYKEQCTRMACQIHLKQDLEGMIINIPKKTGVKSN